VSQSADFQIDQQETLEDVVVEDQIDVEGVVVEPDLPLTGHKREALAEFQQESLKIIDDGLFEAALAEFRRIGQAQELQDVRRPTELLPAVSDLPVASCRPAATNPGLASVGDDSLVVRRD
jgi:hypothetical protein